MWTKLVRFNVGLVITAAAAGWIASSVAGASMPPHASAVPRHGAIADAAYIFSMNLRVGGMLLAGVCTLGVLSAAQLLWHGYWLGYALSALARTAAAGTMPLVLSYLPFEFLAFVLLASVAEGAAYMIVRTLALREPARPAVAVRLFAAAVSLLAAGACIEAWVKPGFGVLRHVAVR